MGITKPFFRVWYPTYGIDTSLPTYLELKTSPKNDDAKT